MDNLTELQAAVELAATVAADYDVTDEHTSTWATALHDDPDLIADTLRAAMLDVADCHADTCVNSDCCLCDHLREPLALILTLARAEMDAELGRRLKENPEDAHRRARLVYRPDPGE